MKRILFAAMLAGALATGIVATPAMALTITATQSGDRTITVNSNAAADESVSWDFGDGGTGTGPSTAHTYASAGTYTINATGSIPPADPTGTPTPDPATPISIHVYAAPTASFTYSVLANGSIQFTDTSTGEPTSWSWSFPGGITSAQQNPVVSLASGSSVSLTVSNIAGSNTATTTITGNSPPVANFSIAPASTVAFGTTVTFTSTSSDPNTGDVLTYSWDFGDPTSALPGTGQAATHSYATPGTYQVTLTVSDGHGGVSSKSQAITVTNSPPVASFTVSPSTTTGIDAQLTFTSTSTDPNNDIAGYTWDFDNGLTASGPVATTTFGDPGNYTVTLTVTDSHGGVSTKSQRITVLADKPPAVSLSFSPANPRVGDNVRFSASASDPDGTVSNIDWDLDNDGLFDDGTGSVVNASFTTAGSRIVAVRATDNMGVATIAFRTVDVTGSGSTASTPGSAPLSTPQGSASSSRRPPLLSPFPIVRIRGAILRGAVRISLLSITGAEGRRGQGRLPRQGLRQEEERQGTPEVLEERARPHVRTRPAQGNRHRGLHYRQRDHREVHELHHPLERRAGTLRSLPDAR